MNNDRFHRKPRHSRANGGVDFQRNRTGERSVALAAASFSYDLYSVFFYSFFFLIFSSLREKMEEERPISLRLVADAPTTMTTLASCHYAARWPENPSSVSPCLMSGNSRRNQNHVLLFTVYL